MFGRILIVAWALLAVFVFMGILSPKFVAWIPHIELVRPYLIILALLTFVYGIAWVYRQGMKRTRSK